MLSSFVCRIFGRLVELNGWGTKIGTVESTRPLSFYFMVIFVVLSCCSRFFPSHYILVGKYQIYRTQYDSRSPTIFWFLSFPSFVHPRKFW